MSKKGGTSTQTNTSSIDPQTQAYLNAYRQSAQGNAGAAGSAADAMAAGGSQLARSIPFAQQTGLNGIESYMNPYQDQVIGGVQQDISRQLAGAGAQANDLATKAGAFGGDRSAILQAAMSRDINQTGLNTIANLRSSGFENAVQQLMADRSRQGQYGLAGLGILGNAQGVRNAGLGGLTPGLMPGTQTNTQSMMTPGDPWGFWGGLAGTVGGALIGGPAGAAVGGKLGSGMLGSKDNYDPKMAQTQYGPFTGMGGY